MFAGALYMDAWYVTRSYMDGIGMDWEYYDTEYLDWENWCFKLCVPFLYAITFNED